MLPASATRRTRLLMSNKKVMSEGKAADGGRWKKHSW